MRARPAVLALLAVATAALGASPKEGSESGRWTPSEMLRYRTIPDVRVSPDGRRLAFVVRQAILESDRSEYREQIWIGRTDGSESHPATFAEQSSNAPRWSPDGTRIAFLSRRGDRHENVWVLPADGGEAWRLTDASSDVKQAAWSPDGRSIAFLASDPDPADHERREKERDDARVVGSEERPVRLWLVSVPSEPDGLRGARPLLTELGSIDDLDWSPDGKSIAVSHRPRPIADDWPKADLSIVDVATGSVTPLARTGAAETEPTYSPDGRWIAYVVTDDPPRWAHRRWIRLVRPDGSGGRDLAHSFDEDPEMAGWSADGTTLYFSEPKGVFDLLYALDVESGRLRALSEPDAVANGAHVNARGTWIGFVRQAPKDAVEAYASPLPAFAPVRVSRVNADLPKYPLGDTRAVGWTGDGGQRIEGLLTVPFGWVAGRRCPLLLVVHGGPAGVYKASAIMAPGPYPVAVFAAEGYAVLRANPRGSSGYGTAFRQANVHDWGGGDYRDLMAGVDAVIAMGVADPDRLGILGWSYGGFMTAWTITQTNRFKAASVGAGVTDLVSFTGTTDIPSFVPDYFGGEFWSDNGAEAYRDRAAMAWVRNVATPTLIEHGEADVRVPISQGYELYNALKRRGVPVEMVAYPRQPHGVREPRLVRDLAERNLAWMNRWVRGAGATAASR
jgi:dipeptidyl aminopeptidase/acylaminoacyl peptidase